MSNVPANRVPNTMDKLKRLTDVIVPDDAEASIPVAAASRRVMLGHAGLLGLVHPSTWDAYSGTNGQGASGQPAAA